MHILRLALENFKGLHSFTFDLNGKNATIYGDNATGKTTLYDAFLWLLFGKDSQGRKDFAIKPMDAPTGIEVSVASNFSLDNGSTVSLKKVLRENWTKKKGKLEAVYSGDVTACYIDGVPKKVTEYTTYIKDLCDESVFKLLTNPLHFNEQIKWQDRRTMLFEVCGDVSDADVIATSADLKDLPVLMGNHTIEDYKKILVEQRKSINKELELLPVRIDEAAKTIVDVDIAAAKAKIATLEPEVNQLEAEIHRLQSGDEIRSLESNLDIAKEALRNLQAQNNRYRDEQEYAAKKVYQSKLDELTAKRRDADYQHNDLENQIFRYKQQMQMLQSKLNDARNDYSVWKSATWDGSETCPTCRQRLPQDQIDASVKRFGDNRADKMKALKTVGESTKSEIAALESEISELGKQSNEVTIERNRIEVEITSLDVPAVSVKDMPGFSKQSGELQSKIDALQQELDSKSANINAEMDALSQRMAALRIQLSDEVKITLIDKQNHDAQARIAEYERQQKEYVRQWEETEKAIILCEQFVRQKTAMVTERVNSKFKLARFKLFDQQVNGGIAECCEVMVDGVTYGNLNNAMWINAGLDIIATLQQHYNFAPPVFIDNAESVVDLYQLPSQVIRLVVSGEDKLLRVAVEP